MSFIDLTCLLATGEAMSLLVLIIGTLSVALMALLFSIAPVLHDITATENALTGQIWQTLGAEVGGFLLRFGLFAAMVVVSAVTCLGTALFLHWALRRWE